MQQYKEAALGSISFLTAELIKAKFTYKGELMETDNQTAERISEILINSRISEGKCKYFMALFFNKKFGQLEEELAKLEEKL